MRTLTAALCALLLASLLAAPVRAAFDQDDLNEIAQKLKAGQGFREDNGYPNEGDTVQLLYVRLRTLKYVIDFRARLCFVSDQGLGYAPVPCRAIAQGYPAVGKLITWQKDGWAE